MKLVFYCLLPAIAFSAGLSAQTFTPKHKVVIEDQTMTAPSYGQWCPRGIVRLDSFSRSSMAERCEIISVHSNFNAPPDDAMYDSTYAASCFLNQHLQCNAWPQFMMDRKLLSEPDSIFINFNKITNDSAIADINLSLYYNATTRILNVTASAHFAEAVTPSGHHYNLALVLTEDSVHGTTLNYAQRNKYAGGTNGAMAIPGLDFATQPDPVPAEIMYYRSVARKIFPSFMGSNLSIPATIEADSIVSYTFPPYVIPSAFNPTNMRAIVLLIDTNTGEIKNANGLNLLKPNTGIENTASLKNKVEIFPNPMSDFATVEFNLSVANPVSYSLYDILGREVIQQSLGLTKTGNNSFTLDGKGLRAGVYSLVIKSGSHYFTSKCMISR